MKQYNRRLKPKNQKGTLLRLISYLGHSKILLLFVILASITSTLAALYGAYSISPLITTIQKGLNNVLSKEAMYQELILRLSFLAVIFTVQVLTSLFSQRMMVKISQRTVRQLRSDMFDNMLKMKVSYHDQNTYGDLMSRFTNDIDLVGEGLNTAAASIVINIFTLAGTIVVMIFLSPILAAVTLTILPFLSIMEDGL